MRHRNAGIGRHGNGAGDAGDDVKRQMRLGERQGLFASSTKEHRVAALEPHDGLAGFRKADEQPLDLGLGFRVPMALLAGIDDLRGGLAVIQQPLRHQMVVDHHIGLLERLQAFDGDQAGIPRTSANEIDNSNFRFWILDFGLHAAQINQTPLSH